ncbi:hypothetical protein, partial [Pseudoalteromonas atlantica]|uniref:hypothetical protein n=1 Tax=Pseudoalteromonas atlantica TaxID=288 RepID=UPI003A97D4AD
MIIGAFLRYYKTYQGINYIPITDEDKFCGLVGDNGIGKSSVLESLDTFFNESPRVCQRLNNLRNWNYEKIKSLYI